MFKVTFLYKNGKTFTVNRVTDITVGDNQSGDKIVIVERVKNMRVERPILANADYIESASLTPDTVPALIQESINATQGELAYLIVSESGKLGVKLIPVTETMPHSVAVDLVRLGV